MGSGSYTTRDWTDFSTSRGYDKVSTKTEDIYKSSGLHTDLDPRKFQFRESVDSNDNPNSTPVIIALDVTGSMQSVLDTMARQGMKTVCEEIYKRKPVSDPHICTLGIGDVECDRSPFQATQFEADVRIFKDLEKIYLEMGGGGNNHESYILAWYFARYRTRTDSFRKRAKKGYIFTIGDEEITPSISEGNFERHLGDSNMRDISAQELFDVTFPEWNIFHVIVKQGSHARYDYEGVKESWDKVIGAQRVLDLDDHTKIGEVIVSAMEVSSGKSVADVSNSWDGDTSLVVREAIKSVVPIGTYQPKSLDAVL